MLAGNARQRNFQFSPYFIWDTAQYENLLEDGFPLPQLDSTFCSNWIAESDAQITNNRIKAYRQKCRDCGCDICKYGISIPQALYELEKYSVVPLLENYQSADCGKTRQNFKQSTFQNIKINSYTLYRARPDTDQPVPDTIIDKVKFQIAHKLPIVVAANIYFDGNFKGKKIFDAKDMKNYLGYHAMTVVGYDDNAANGEEKIPTFKIINSWGDGWGDQGYISVSREAFKRMVKEIYVVTLNSAEDLRPIDVGQKIGTAKIKLAYRPFVDDKEIEICLDANTYSEASPGNYPQEVIAYGCKPSLKNQVWGNSKNRRA